MALVNITSPTTTANVISGDIMRQLVGVWTADLVIDQIDGTGFDPGTKVTITSQDGYSLSGVVDPNRQGTRLDAVHVRVLGGAGGMLSNATARAFVQPGAYVRDVLNALCSNAGETLSTTIDPTFLASNLTAWSIAGGNTVARSLRALLEIVAPGANWRTLDDGTIWIGNETWPQSSVTYDVLNVDPSDGSFHLGSEAPFISPGMNLPTVGNVSRVQDIIADGKMRSRVWIDFPGQERGQNSATQQMAKQALPRIDYFGQYECKVLAQSSDLSTVDVLPVVAKFAGLQRVPLRLGLPGVTAQFAPGAKVLLGWKGGDPSQPFASLHFGGETLTALTIGSAADNVATKADLSALLTAISNTVIVAQDGGLSFKTTLLAALSPPKMVPAWPVCSQTVSVQR